MAKAHSLHVGLNAVDPNAYNGWDGTLSGCEADAAAMLAIAASQNYESSISLLTGEATAAAVLAAISEAAGKLVSGDLFLLTYSGHGARIPDPEEPGKQVDTWALFDRMLLGHELHRAWGNFAAGVRVFVTSDSCHSGTVTRYVPDRSHPTAPRRSRAVPHAVEASAYQAHQEMYDRLARENPRSLAGEVNASVLLISGCQDSQESSDGDGNGLFTTELLSVWNGGQFAGTYKSFYDDILQAMPDLNLQRPNYFLLGAASALWEEDRPFVP